MKNKTIILVAFYIFTCTTLCFSASRGIQITGKKGKTFDLYKDYHALVVGVGDYTEGWPDLPGALKDCEEVAGSLEGYGFTVKTLKNPTSKVMNRALAELTYRTGGESDRGLLLYFAGHGETMNLADGNSLGFIIPSDCPLKNQDPIGFDDLAISMKEIEALSLKVKSKHLLMVFDSCFSGSLFNLVRAAPMEISEKSTMPVRQFITAGSSGEQVPDTSVFKQVFLDGIKGDADLNKDGYITGSELGMHLQTKVVNYSRGGQHPQYGKINNPKLDKGDFIFVVVVNVQEKAEASGAYQDEKNLIAEELKKLREERKKNTELLERIEKLVDDRPGKVESVVTAKEKTQTAYIPKSNRSNYNDLKKGKGSFLIDDFEDGDLFASSFNDTWRSYQKGKCKVDLTVDRTQGANGTSCSMKFDFNLVEKSTAVALIGGGKSPSSRIKKVHTDRSKAHNLSRFNKLVFYLKGEKSRSMFSNPNPVYLVIDCYGRDIKAAYGNRRAEYTHKIKIIPDNTWERHEVLFENLMPSLRTKTHAANYPQNPDLSHVLWLEFLVTSHKPWGGRPESHKVWIDEIWLE